MPKLDAEIVIIGAGPVGATLAGLLGRAGMDCLVLNTAAKTSTRTSAKTDTKPAATSTPDPDPRTVATTRTMTPIMTLAITPASRRILEHLDLWRQLPKERIGYFRRIRVWDENGGGAVEFDSAELCEAALGYIIEQALIQAALDELLEVLPTVSIQRNATVIDLKAEEEKMSVALADGRSFSARLIVAADGADSATRKLAGIHYEGRDYVQQALACVVKTARPHEHIARQRFLTRGPLAFLPLADPQHCGVVWSSTPEHVRDLLALDEEHFRRELQTAFAQNLGEVLHSSPRLAFPLQRAQAQRYCRPRFALVGDAAHSVHPLAGQGANLGLLDAASLFEVIQAARQNNKDVGSLAVLRRYERWRRGENYLMMMAFEGFKYLFETQTRPLPALRNAGMRIVNRLGPLKKQIMRRAMGRAGDLPQLAKTGG